MIRNYSNPRIYKNLIVVEILSIISLIISAIYVIYDLAIFFLTEKLGNSVYFYVFAIIIPLSMPSLKEKEKRKKIHAIENDKPRNEKPTKKETRLYNDYSNTLVLILSSLTPYLFACSFLFLGIFSDYMLSESLFWFRMCGTILLFHIPVYVADGFLISNCVLIKREWKENPPAFQIIRKEKILKAKKRKEKLKKEKELYQKKKTAKFLLENCGIKFFIKYYSEIKNLPLRDVEITENYSSTEKEERLLSAKKLINFQLTEVALTEALSAYRNNLLNEEKERINAILLELQEEK